jgi:MFS family permease
VSGGAERDPSLLRGAFDHPEVRGLLLAEAFSDLGDQIARVALALLVFARTDSVLASAMTLAVAYLPGIFGSAVLGSLADRLPRRAVLLWCDVLRAFIIALLALVAVDATPLVVLLLLLLASEFVASPFTSARTALFGDVLADRDLYSAALTIGRSVNLTAQVVGFLAGGIVVGWLGPRLALAVDALTFLLSYAVIRARVTTRGAADEPGTSARRLLADMVTGFGELMSDPSRRAMVLFGWASALFLIAPEAVAVGYSLDQPAWVSGLLLASVPAGSALGALLLGRLALPRQTELLLPLAALSCLPLFATSVGPPPGVAVCMWFVAGIFQAYVITVVASITYLTEPLRRGRVMGVAASGFNASTAISFLVVGWLAQELDPARAVSLAGAVGLVVVAVAYAIWPSRVVT